MGGCIFLTAIPEAVWTSFYQKLQIKLIETAFLHYNLIDTYRIYVVVMVKKAVVVPFHPIAFFFVQSRFFRIFPSFLLYFARGNPRRHFNSLNMYI
jgi:hypothetical protein